MMRCLFPRGNRRPRRFLTGTLLLSLFVSSLWAETVITDQKPWWRHPAAEMNDEPSTITEPPQPHFDPRDYGAKGDGQSYDTAALQKAIDACSGTGGSVILSSGKFVSAQLTLRRNMTFLIAKDAVLLGGTNPLDYPDLAPRGSTVCYRRSLLYADHADGLIIDGEGVIDGRGGEIPMYGVETKRPSLLRIFNSNDVVVRNVTMKNTRMWTQVYTDCRRLLIDHVTVRCPFYDVYRPSCGFANFDGMDICDCSDVIIRNCDAESEDDTICLKSQNESGLSNILIQNNRVTSLRANAIKFGTSSVGPLSNVRILDNTVRGAKYGGLCIESVDGSKVSDVLVRGLDMHRVSQPIFIRVGKRANTRPAGSIDGVVIERVRALDPVSLTKPSCSITGTPSAPVGEVRLKDCYIEMPGGLQKTPAQPKENDAGYPHSNIFGDTTAWGIFVRHAAHVVLENVSIGRIRPDARPCFAAIDAKMERIHCHDLGQIAPLPSDHPPINPR